MFHRQNPSKLIGKTIKDIILVNRTASTPHCQVFILFDDNTHFEFYGDNILTSGGIDEGGKNAIMNYIRNSGAYVKRLAD